VEQSTPLQPNVMIVAVVSFLFKHPWKMNTGHNKLKIEKQNITDIISIAAVLS